MSPYRCIAALFAAGACALLAGAAPALAAGDADVAALQLALRTQGLYTSSVDGIPGPATTEAIRRFQSANGLVVDGVAGPATREALGRRGRPKLGTRALASGASGYDVAGLQFLLAKAGFPSGPVDGGLGPRTTLALRRFQLWAGLSVDGVAGPATIAALQRGPVSSGMGFVKPVAAHLGDRFGPRGDAFHSGVDYVAGAGQAVLAAGRGCVSFAGYASGGYGNLIVIDHGNGMTSWYAHLSALQVRNGACVSAGQQIGLVGSTGRSTGPHLHFELRLRGAVIDPLANGVPG